MADFILIHGTTQSPAGFEPLVKELAQRGHRTYTPQIRGPADARAVEHAEQLAAQLPTDLHRPVVLAHSAAGLLLPALARRLDAAHQVWLAAAVADYPGGRSLLTEIHADPQMVFNPKWIGIDPTSDQALATYFLFHDADLAALRHGLSTLQLTDLSGVYAETPGQNPAQAWSTYLLPRDDSTLRPHWMAHVARDRLNVEPIELAGGHNLYTAQPALVAETITAAL